MWLLDANMDVHLYSLLRELGVNAESAAFRGWKALENGQLVSAAIASGFDCLLTRDGLFGESASKALKQFPNFAIVVVTLQQQPWPTYKMSFLNQWRVQPIVPIHGRLTSWPDDDRAIQD